MVAPHIIKMNSTPTKDGDAHGHAPLQAHLQDTNESPGVEEERASSGRRSLFGEILSHDDVGASSTEENLNDQDDDNSTAGTKSPDLSVGKELPDGVSNTDW